jgi:hypothetical protein
MRKISLRIGFLILWGIIGLVFAIGPLGGRQTVNEISKQCVAKCRDFGQAGHLVGQAVPRSPKPSAQKFECVCS